MSKGFSVFTAFKAKDGLTPAFKSMTKGSNVFTNNLVKTKGQLKQFGSCVQQTCGKINTVFNAAIGYFAIDTVKEKINSFIDSASDLQETIGKTGEVFKANSGDVENWAKTSIKNMGLAEQTALDTAALYGDMGTGMGMTTKRASEMAMSLTQLSADMASFKNVEQGLAANALKGIFTGETEALKNMGVVMTETVLQEYAKAAGIRKKMKDMTQAEKIELRYQYVMKSTKNAQGDFVRTFGNYANQKRVGEELRKQAEINIGKILLPTWNKFMVLFNTFFTNNLDKITTNFEKFFNYLKGLFKSFSPVFDELKKTVQIFSKDVGPAVLELAPAFETVFKNLLVPALVVTIGAFNKLLTGIMAVCKFISENWIPLVSVMAGVGGMLALKKAFDVVTGAVTWFNTSVMIANANGVVGMITGIDKLKFVLGGYTQALWASVKAIAAQTAALLMNPWTWVAIGIAAVVAGAILVWKNWDKITAALKTFWAKCVEVFTAFKTFFQNNFLDILLIALGPIGMIIEGIIKIGGAIRGVKKNADGANVPATNSPRIKNPSANYNQGKNGKFSGSIDVGVTIDNKTAFPATNSLNLSGDHGLNLSPSYP